MTRSRELKGGIESQKLTVKMSDAEATFAKDSDTGAYGKAKISITYRAHFYTDDASWSVGCDSEVIDSIATFVGKLGFHVYPKGTRRELGREQRLANGWAVELDRTTEQLNMVTTGKAEYWESLLQERCLSTPITEPIGWWSPYFTYTNEATGKLNGGGKGVILTNVYTEEDQTYEVDGSIKFSKSVESR